jgi:hypothetical protein
MVDTVIGGQNTGMNKDLNKGAALYRKAAKGGYGFELGPYFYSKNFETFDNVEFMDVRKKIDIESTTFLATWQISSVLVTRYFTPLQGFIVRPL